MLVFAAAGDRLQLSSLAWHAPNTSNLSFNRHHTLESTATGSVFEWISPFTESFPSLEAGPTAIASLQLRSGRPHSDRELAVDVQRGMLPTPPILASAGITEALPLGLSLNGSVPSLSRSLHSRQGPQRSRA